MLSQNLVNVVSWYRQMPFSVMLELPHYHWDSSVSFDSLLSIRIHLISHSQDGSHVCHERRGWSRVSFTIFGVWNKRARDLGNPSPYLLNWNLKTHLGIPVWSNLGTLTSFSHFVALCGATQNHFRKSFFVHKNRNERETGANQHRTGVWQRPETEHASLDWPKVCKFIWL